MVEISQLGITETALGTRDARRTDHIDETIGMLIDETDTLLAGFWRNHHDDTDVILVGNGFHHLQIIIKRKVWDDGAAHSALYAALEESLNAVVHDRVQITHQHEWKLHFILDFLQLGEEFLTVYTYDSFSADWGPGPAVKKAFEAECGCELKFVALEDGVSLLNRLRMEGKNSKADVVLGLDNNLLEAAAQSKLFAKSNVPASAVSVPGGWDNDTFVPYDYGYFAFVYDKNKLANPPKSLKELVEGPQKWRVIYEDPRTSTPGLGLLLWMQKVYGDQAPEAWQKLAAKTVTVDGVLEARRYHKFEEFFRQFRLLAGGGTRGNFDLQIVALGEARRRIVVFLLFNHVVGRRGGIAQHQVAFPFQEQAIGFAPAFGDGNEIGRAHV